MKRKIGVRNTCFCIYFIINFMLCLVMLCHASRHFSSDSANYGDVKKVYQERRANNALKSENVLRDSRKPLQQEYQLPDDIEGVKPSDDNTYNDYNNNINNIENSFEDAEYAARSAHRDPSQGVGTASITSHDEVAPDGSIPVIVEMVNADVSSNIAEDKLSSDAADKTETPAKNNTSSPEAKFYFRWWPENETPVGLENPDMSSSGDNATSFPSSQNYERNQFNYSDAITRGKLYQLEFCSPASCRVGTHGGVGTYTSSPKCAECYCDEECIKYRDCCNASDDVISENESTEPLRTECFEFESGSGVSIVSSCPESSARQQAPPSDVAEFNEEDRQYPTETKPLSLAKCHKCKRSRRRKSLVTSEISGVTYCNKHCLACNEPGTNSSSSLVWLKSKECTPEDEAAWSATSSLPKFSERIFFRENNTKMAKICKVTFEPSSSKYHYRISFRKCSVYSKLEEVNDCGVSNSMKSVDNETFGELSNLCGSYDWPVYSKTHVFRNIFCFLCRGDAPRFEVRGVLGVSVFNGRANLPNMALLTDISGRFTYVDVSLERQAYENSGEGASQSDEGYGQSSKNRSSTTHCDAGFWFNFLTGECIPVRCSKGRNLTTTPHYYQSSASESESQGEPLDLLQICLPAKNRNETEEMDDGEEEDGAKFYVLKVLWYLVSNDDDDDLDRESGQDENGEDLDLDTGAPTDGQQKTLFSCDAYNAVNFAHDEGNLRRYPNVYIENNYYNLTLVPIELPADYNQTIPDDDDDDDVTFKNESKAYDGVSDHSLVNETDGSSRHIILNVSSLPLITMRPFHYIVLKDESEAYGVFDYFLMNETDRLLRQANVSSMSLMKMKVSARNDRDSKDLPLHETREIVVYFQRSPPEGRDEFERKIVDLFSAKTETVYNGTTFKFRSVLVQKYPITAVLNDTQKFRYFSQNSIVSNDTVCCDEMNFAQFSRRLSKVACAQASLKPATIHLVSTCPHVILNATDFNVTRRTQTLIHKRRGITLQRHQYLRSKSSILVCVSVIDSFGPKVARSILSGYHALMWWEGVLTLVFLPISMLCLLITFLTYCAFPILRSMPGKNNMFLVFWLFWAQTFTIVSALTPRHSTACAVMGMLLHFSWLATLTWTCVCSFHMFNVFVIQRGTPNDGRSHRWYVTCYSLLSHLLPLLVILVVCVVTSGNLTSTGSLGYGGVVCYLNSTVLVVLAFLLPLAVVLVANMAFFFCTVVSISRIEKIKRQSGIAEKRNPYIYAKLSSLTSITWVLALLAEIPGCHFLRLVSVAVNSSQGIFLFVSYIVNGRVKRLWGSLRKSKRSNGKSNLATNTYTNASATSTKLLTVSTPNVTTL